MKNMKAAVDELLPVRQTALIGNQVNHVRVSPLLEHGVFIQLDIPGIDSHEGVVIRGPVNEIKFLVEIKNETASLME